MTPHLGISLSEPKTKPCFKIHRFSVYQRESLALLEPEVQKRNLNYQINGASEFEKIVVRVFLDECGQIYKSRYYFLEGMDNEMAHYLALELIHLLSQKHKIRHDHQLKELNPWK